MKVAAVRRDPTKEDGGLCDIPLSDKKELFAQSDFVVCVLPGTPQTLDYCGAEEFAAMKPSAVFISIGRGVCVDEGALAAALQAGQIKGAALDVFKVEPLPETSPLWDCGEPPCLHCLPATAPFFARAADAKPVSGGRLILPPPPFGRREFADDSAQCGLHRRLLPSGLGSVGGKFRAIRCRRVAEHAG